MKETSTLVADLHKTIQYITWDIVDISVHSLSNNNGNIWAIKGPKKHPIVLLFYENESKLADENDSVCDAKTSIKQEVLDNLICNSQNNAADPDIHIPEDSTVVRDVLSPNVDSVCQLLSSFSCKRGSIVEAFTSQSSTCKQKSREEVENKFRNSYKIKSKCVSNLPEITIDHATMCNSDYVAPDVDISLRRSRNSCDEVEDIQTSLISDESNNTVEPNSLQLSDESNFFAESQTSREINNTHSPEHNTNIWEPVVQCIVNYDEFELKNCSVSLKRLDLPSLKDGYVSALQEQNCLENEQVEPVNTDACIIHCSYCGERIEMVDSVTTQFLKSGEMLYCCPDCNKFACQFDTSNEDNVNTTVFSTLSNDLDSSNDASFRELHRLCKKRKLKLRKQVVGCENLLQCPLCDKKFLYKRSLKQHKLVHGVAKLLKFSESGNIVKCGSKIKKGIYSGLKLYKCSKCDGKFSSKILLKEHRKVHCDEKLYECSQCEKTFSMKTHLEIHKQKHLGGKPFLCLQCGKNFSHRATLEQHKIIHSGEQPYECTLCNRRFNVKSNLQRHQQVHLKDKNAYKFLQHENHLLDANVQSFSGNISYVCQLCGKNFTNKVCLEQHELVHNEEKFYECSLCDVKFNAKNDLELHKFSHAEKSYSCPYCETVFTKKHLLDAHKRMHLGTKPHTCLLCGKTFTYKGNLEQHTLIHTGEKPYNCNFCGKKFNVKSNLERHKVLHSR